MAWKTINPIPIPTTIVKSGVRSVINPVTLESIAVVMSAVQVKNMLLRTVVPPADYCPDYGFQNKKPEYYSE